eukprot:m.1212356 g.1212356  ORF g.1212356 m.1212356 type:complete len:119 (+) comp24597_c0_seq46:2085-2441(+)
MLCCRPISRCRSATFSGDSKRSSVIVSRDSLTSHAKSMELDLDPALLVVATRSSFNMLMTCCPHDFTVRLNSISMGPSRDGGVSTYCIAQAAGVDHSAAHCSGIPQRRSTRIQQELNL